MTQTPKVHRQIHQQLRPAFLREEVDDPVQSLVGVVGVQGGNAQVTGFGKRQGVFHGLPVPNLADQDHIRRLAQGGAPVLR